MDVILLFMNVLYWGMVFFLKTGGFKMFGKVVVVNPDFPDFSKSYPDFIKDFPDFGYCRVVARLYVDTL